MKVNDIMAVGAVTTGPQKTVADAAALMKMQNVGMLVVVDREEPVGVVTDRDLIVSCVGRFHNPASCIVSRHVSDRVITTTPWTDALDAARTMRENRIRRLPVIEYGELQGVVSFSDIARCLDVALRDVLLGMSGPPHVAQITLAGEVTHYYSHLGVAAVKVEYPIRVGDRIIISGRTTNIEQIAESMELDHKPVEAAGQGENVGIKLVGRARVGDSVYVAIEDAEAEVPAGEGDFATVG